MSTFVFIDHIDGVITKTAGELLTIARRAGEVTAVLVGTPGHGAKAAAAINSFGANKIIAISESKSEIKFEELPEDDPKQRKPDIQKAKDLLGWEPNIQLERGIEKTLDYFKNVLGL